MMDNVFGIHEHALNIRIERAKMIANNIANAETPNYKARDLDFKSILNRENKSDHANNQHDSGLKQTHQHHVKHLFDPMSLSDLKFRIPAHAAFDGNTVDTHLEKSAFLQNAMNFQASFRFLNGRITGLINAFKGES